MTRLGRRDRQRHGSIGWSRRERAEDRLRRPHLRDESKTMGLASSGESPTSAELSRATMRCALGAIPSAAKTRKGERTPTEVRDDSAGAAGAKRRSGIVRRPAGKRIPSPGQRDAADVC